MTPLPDVDAVAALRGVGTRRGDLVGVAIGGGAVGLAAVASERPITSWAVTTADASEAAAIVAAVEAELRPRWVWWSVETPAVLTSNGVRVAMCWDVAAVHRLLFGGWKAEPARVWAALHGLALDALPSMGQLGLLDMHGDDGGDPADPVRNDGHLRPEWTGDGWASSPARVAAWAGLALRTAQLQERMLATVAPGRASAATARSESAAELLCAELSHDGLPIDRRRAEELMAASIGPRPRSEAERERARRDRDEPVLALARSRAGMDLRNPAHVRTMLAAAGVHVTDTRAWRLEPYRETNPFVDALLVWRKAERIATTYGYDWLDQHVGADDRLRGTWTGCDGAAGRMTASAGLHNLPAALRDAVAAEDGHVFVHADLGQIEPRVLAAVSGDPALAAATQADDLYAPVAARLGVERPVAKVAVLAAMYGQTSGTAGEALKGMESAYRVAMELLRAADRNGRARVDMRTYGGRLIRFGAPSDVDPARAARAADLRSPAAGARGRYARNALIQGAAAELFKAWAVTVRGRIAPLGGRIVLCLHDELLVHVPAAAGDEVAGVLEASLGEAAARWMPGGAVRYVAKASVVRRWSEAK